MSEEAEPETRPRIMVLPLLDALEYDATVHLHRGQPPIVQPKVAQTEQADGEAGDEQATTTVKPPKVLPWRNYMQAQSKRAGTAGAGLGLLLAGGLLLLVGVYYIGNDADLYIDSLPKPTTKVSQPSTNISAQPKYFQPFHIGPDIASESDEEATTSGTPLPVNWLPWCLLHLTFFPLAIYGCIRGAVTCIKKAEETEIGVPLTSANTGHLPAAESLVRASEKFVPPSQEVLLRPSRPQTSPEHMLRPAAYSEAKLPEQLVRPAGGQE